MFKWFKEQQIKADNRAGAKVVTALEKYLEVPATDKYKRMRKLDDIFILIRTAKDYNTVKADYIGGYYLMQEPKKNVSITIVNDTLIFNYEDGILIKLEDIIEVSINSSEQISHRVTATRLVTAGVLALAIPKKTVDILQYLVIRFKDNSTEQELVLAGEKLGQLHSELYKRVNKIGA